MLGNKQKIKMKIDKYTTNNDNLYSNIIPYKLFKERIWNKEGMTLESPLDSREIKPVNPKGVNPKYSLEVLVLKLKFWYFGHLMRRANSLEKTLMLGNIEDKRRGWQRMRWLDSITDSMDMDLNKLQEIAERTGRPGMLQSIRSQNWTQLSSWTRTTKVK